MRSRRWFFEPRWVAVWFLTVASALNYGDRSAMSAVLSVLQSDFKLTDVQVGLLGSLFLWSYALGSPLAGSLGDRVPRGRLVIGSLAAWSGVMVLTGLTTGYPVLLALRVALGAGECLFLPAAIALIAVYHPIETRARAMSLITVGANCGMIVGGSAAGFFADHYGWRVGFFVLGAAGVALALGGRPMLRAPAAAEESGARRVSPLAALRYVLRVPTYYILTGEALLAGLGIWIFFTWLPLYFRETYHLTLAAAGFAGTFMLQISVVLGMLAGGWVSDRLAGHAPQRRLLLFGAGYLLGAPFLLLFLGQPTFAVVAAGVSTFSFFRGFAQSNERPAQCEIVPPEYRATCVGWMNAVATAAGGCGVLLAGFLKREVGLAGVFAGISLCYVLAGALLIIAWAFFVRRDIRRAQERTAS